MPALTPRRFALLLALLLWPTEATAASLSFRVRLDCEVATEPITGRLYVFLSRVKGEPRFGPNWFHPEPFFALDVQQFQPDATVEIGDRAVGFPASLRELPPGQYRAQAVLDHSFSTPQPGMAAGNFYSSVVTIEANRPGTVDLLLNRTVEPPPFPESQWLDELVLRSELLSTFHQRDVFESATIELPGSYFDHPDHRYPVLYIISGFGGHHRMMARQYPQPTPVEGGEVEFIRVLLAGQCRWGHHEYANSATNGPRGDALIREMIPEIDRRYRTIAEPAARLVTGHSSGGWSSLWLQVNYPDSFGGVWSSAPDPVDFRDFQQVNLYAAPPLSLFRDPQGRRRPIARRGTEPVLWFESFVHMDDVLGRGGQFRSFEAVFSPLGPDGLPRKICNRSDGQIDPQVAQAWQRYDIRLLLERHWPVLGLKLQGKLHIVAGELDTFYLQGAVQRLAESLHRLGSDAEVKIVPGKDHSTLLTPELARQTRLEMSRAILKNRR